MEWVDKTVAEFKNSMYKTRKSTPAQNLPTNSKNLNAEESKQDGKTKIIIENLYKFRMMLCHHFPKNQCFKGLRC